MAYCTILYYTILYYTILHYTTLHYTTGLLVHAAEAGDGHLDLYYNYNTDMQLYVYTYI